MPTYRYKARDKFGKPVTGVIGSDSEEAAAMHLEKMGYTPVSVIEHKESRLSSFLEKFKRVSQEDLNLFTRQMVTLLKAGIPIVASLQSVEKQTNSRVLRKVIQELIRDIEAGNSFSEALTRQPRTFDALYASTVRAGEVSGMMDEVLDRLSDLGEHEQDTKSKIKVATRYPLFAFCVLFIGFLIMAAFVLPRFVQIFAQMETELPLPTIILIKTNYLLRRYWYAALIFLGFAGYGVARLLKTKKGRLLWDSFLLKMPIFGPLINMLMMARFSRIMAIMVKSGVPILDILDTVSNTVGNVILSNALIGVREGVKQGKAIAEPMRISGVFSPIVLQMIAVGEETGRLDELMLRVSEYYDKQADYMIKNLATTIEPVFITVLASGVLLLALSVFLPMWNMLRALRG